VIAVGLSEWKEAERPDRLRTAGLGSCVGVVVYDDVAGRAAMAHVMLPDHHLARSSFHPAKFADTAVPGLVELLLKKGSAIENLKAKFAGGAEMFPRSGGNGQAIGARNITAVMEGLRRLNIPLIARDTGGNAGRTIEFDTVTSKLYIRTVKRGEKEI